MPLMRGFLKFSVFVALPRFCGRKTPGMFNMGLRTVNRRKTANIVKTP